MRAFMLLVVLLIIPLQGYRLNVPRVLLPYHPSATVSFELVVSDPEGGCFKWKSTRPDIISVKIQGDGVCADRAVIVANSKHTEEQTAVVFAEDHASQVVLSCGVSVDLIRSISISTTTKVLFLDASPAKIVVHAANSEGDMFSSLGEIPFEWQVRTESANDRPLRIIPFSKSKYEAPEGVRTLEELRKRGYVVLVEGVSTGAATLKASLAEDFFKDVSSREIDLLVVANVILMPSQDMYIPLGARLRYSAQIIKQTKHQEVTLPSKQYRLLVNDESVCSFDEDQSMVTAIKLGSTQIAIIDHNVKAKHLVKPPSAHIHVVSPWSISFWISTGSWYLQKGERYEIGVMLIDNDDNNMFITENAVFETVIPEEYFEIESESKNKTYFHVKAIKTGVVTLKSSFMNTVDENGEISESLSEVRGERMVTISDRVVVSPKVIVLPYERNTQQHSWGLKAEGGTGYYIWSTDDPNISSVGESGIVRAQGVGTTQVHATDANNPLNTDHVIVRVLPPVRIQFNKSKRETEIGSTLELSIGMVVEWENQLLSVIDCTNVDFAFSVQDNSVFSVVKDYTPRAFLNGEGCSSVLLKAVGDGDTTLTLTTDNLSANIIISAYPKLELETPSAMLMSVGSEIELITKGGPRPWIADPSGYFSKVTYSESVDLITHRTERGRHFISCRQANGDIVVGVKVGNDKTESNRMPSECNSELRVCCSMPTRLSLAIMHDDKLKQSNACPVNTLRIISSSPSQLVLSAYGKCDSGVMSGIEKRFDSISALQVQFSTDEPKLLKIEVPEKQVEGPHIFASAVPQGRIGASEIVAKTEKYRINGKDVQLRTKLWTAIDTNIVNLATIQPSKVVVWNEKSTVKKVQIMSGSEHFEVVKSFDETVVDVQLKNNVLEIRPSSVGTTRIAIVDVCFGIRLMVTVTVTDIHHIAISAPDFVAVNEEISVRISLSDANGTEFSSEDVTKTNIELTSDSKTAINIIREDTLHYRIEGLAVGVVNLIASAKTASGRDLRSVPEVIQVFAPLQLLPKEVTLIQGSVFQLEVLGGPEPTPGLAFSLNDSSIASVADNGLITSTKLGVTKVTGTINVRGTESSKASVKVRVVSLRGIRIILSSHRLEQGTEGWAMIEGISQQETPFSFGGALYPLRIIWTLHTHSHVHMVHTSGCPIQENNQFEVLLKALEQGQTQLHVAVHMHPQAKNHFKSGRIFEDTVTISVVEPIRLLQPYILPQAIRMTPGASLKLKANRADGIVRVKVPSDYSSIAEIGDNVILKAHSQGQALIELNLISNSHNESTFVPIKVLPVHSIHISPQTVIPISGIDDMNGIYPLGYRISLKISFRDHAGRIFDSTDIDVKFRPHRFDKTRITMSEDRRMMTVHLKKEGDTVIKVWDSKNPSVSAYQRLSVASGIRPSGLTVTQGDIVCFKSALPCGAWRESVQDSKLNIMQNGAAIAMKPGTSVVMANVDTDQSLFTKVEIKPADEIHMVKSPSIVSNIPNKRFVFPVIIGNNSNAVNVHGCDTSEMEKLEGIQAPFECMVQFKTESTLPAISVLMADAIFVSNIGSYACVLSEGLFGSSKELIGNDKMDLLVTARWTRASKVIESAAKSLYLARFELDPAAIHLNNVRSQQAHVTLTAPKSVLGSVILEGCAEGVMIIAGPKQISSNTAKYSIKLNVNSATLWREFLKECNITIRSDLTGQLLQLHTKITLHGDASKAVINASEGVMNYLTELIGNSMMVIGTLVVTLICVLIIIAHHNGYHILPNLLGDSVFAQPQSGAVFASDRPSPSPGYTAWRSMTHNVVSPSQSTPFGRKFAENSLSPSPKSQSPINKSSGFSPGRSAAPLSPPETFLWSTGDSLNTPGGLREGKY